MKKKVKYILMVVVAVAVIAGIAASVLTPLSVATVTLQERNAELYFIEQGFVRENQVVDVLTLSGGRVVSVNTHDGQEIRIGSVIATLDSTDLEHEIAQFRLNNVAIEAQIANFIEQERRTRDTQQTTLNSLRGEYEALLAQRTTAQTTELDQSRIRTENIRLQSILVDQSRSDVDAAETELASFTELFEAGAISRNELDSIERALTHAQTQLATNLQTLEIVSTETNAAQDEYFAGMLSSVQAQISGLERQIAGSSGQHPMVAYYNTLIESGNNTIANLERRIADNTITSPIDGVITDMHIVAGNILLPSQPVARITAERLTPGMPSLDMIEVFVSTMDIDNIREGDAVELTLRRQLGDAVYRGFVLRIYEGAEIRVSSLGVEERRVRVVVSPSELTDSFRPGFDVDVRFNTYFAENQVMVPKTAIFTENGQDVVFVIENGRAVVRSVTLGVELRAEHVIDAGLSQGDIVIRDANTTGLRTGTRVASE